MLLFSTVARFSKRNFYMKNTSILKFSFLGWILIYLASWLAFNQKVISQTKRVDLSIEDIVDRDMLDNSSSLRRTYNKTAGFNGKTYKIPIKYYIHNKNQKVNLNFQPFKIYYAYEISDDVERFIVDTFDNIDTIIDLDFKRVYSSEKANITIYKTKKFHDKYDAYSEFNWIDDDIIYSQIVWHEYKFKSSYKIQKLKDYPTLPYDFATHLLHEISHSLGLLHSGCGQDWCEFNFDPDDSRINSRDTIMSYNLVPSQNTLLTNLDIEALKAIWGAEKDN